MPHQLLGVYFRIYDYAMLLFGSHRAILVLWIKMEGSFRINLGTSFDHLLCYNVQKAKEHTALSPHWYSHFVAYFSFLARTVLMKAYRPTSLFYVCVRPTYLLAHKILWTYKRNSYSCYRTSKF